ncbi:hypothetical protein LG204_10735 [Methylovorus menthalis]|uniref:hypothetical protein n=1 Tax=Methylovorus menthalis TaxID=1002227 RepID=UPI001E600B6F|nr:hypothetical protein [Methylovorus menthalis]MCB4811792.1 hypothetical protein [Methylovorus menthalis]
MQGFHHRGEYPIPDWAHSLRNYYWHIRVEGRDKAKRRKFYRLVEKEKLRLAESYVDQKLIIMVCRYLATMKALDGKKMQIASFEAKIQMVFYWGDCNE